MQHSDDLFEAVSHPMRIEIVKALAEKPLRFADLKRALKISSSGLLDFHLKKLSDLITTNDEGNYALTERDSLPFKLSKLHLNISGYGQRKEDPSS